MIMELKTIGHDFTNELQIQAIIWSLLDSWEHMKVNITYNENIKTFTDIAHHLELEDEHLEAAKPDEQAYVVASNSNNVFGFKQKRNFGKWKANKAVKINKGPN